MVVAYFTMIISNLLNAHLIVKVPLFFLINYSLYFALRLFLRNKVATMVWLVVKNKINKENNV